MSLRATLYRAALGLNRIAARELSAMRELQWLPRADLESLQMERLEQLLRYAAQHVPYYERILSEAGVVSGSRVRLDRFECVPFLDKRTIRANFDALKSDELWKLRASRNFTGGTTGEPLCFYQDRASTRIAGGVVLRLFYEWHGIRPGDREVRVWGSQQDLTRRGRRGFLGLRERLAGVRLHNAFLMTPDSARACIQLINWWRPLLLRGYASALYELALFSQRWGMPVRPPKTVISSAGTLYESARAIMKAAYGCNVYNHYGSREMHNIAMECPAARGLHISTFTVLLEVIDDAGRRCPPEVEGDIVVTGLMNFAMPLIRYRTGDRGAVGTTACSCGRGLPLLAKLVGRRLECFRTREGGFVPGEYFVHILGSELGSLGIGRFQVVQRGFDCVVFRVATDEHATFPEECRRRLRDATQTVMGPDCVVEFEFLREIPPARSGKYFYTLCELDAKERDE